MSNSSKKGVFSKKTERLFLLCVGLCGRIVLTKTLAVAKIATTNPHGKSTKGIPTLQRGETWKKMFMNIVRHTRLRHLLCDW